MRAWGEPPKLDSQKRTKKKKIRRTTAMPTAAETSAWALAVTVASTPTPTPTPTPVEGDTGDGRRTCRTVLKS